MSAAREAIVLPSILLTVAMIGGVRPSGELLVAPPAVFALVLAVLLLGVLVQSGAYDPWATLHAGRPPLARANGVVLLGALVLAAAQLFSLLTPQAGLPRLVLSGYFLVLMLNTLAAAPDRVRVLRSLGVTFGAAFLVKYVLLAALSDPAASRVGRALQLLLEGITLGSVSQDAQPEWAGYLSFAAVCLFLVAVWMLPRRAEMHDGEERRYPRIADRAHVETRRIE